MPWKEIKVFCVLSLVHILYSKIIAAFSVPPKKITSTSFIFMPFFFFLILMHGLYTETNESHRGLTLSWTKSREGCWGFLLFFFFFWSRVTTARTIFGQHTFSNSAFVFSSCWYFSIILNTRNGSKCLGSLLKVQLAPIPQVIPLEGFPTPQEHPIKKLQNRSKTSIPTQSPSPGDLCLSSSKERNPDAPDAQINGQKEHLHRPPSAWEQGRAGKRWQQTRLWQELGPSFATGRHSCPTEGCGYGATSPGQTLITLIRNKAMKLLVSLCKPAHSIARPEGERS